MATINDNFLKLPGSYLFSEIARRVSEYAAAHPDKKLIRLGIGDVTRPLVPAVTEALHKAVDEMATSDGFHGYGPEQGYDFLREAIAKNDYQDHGISISADEVFVSDGAKSDCGNIGDIFGTDNIVAMSDPVYPAYADTNAMAGRAGTYIDGKGWDKFVYLPCTAENNFSPAPPSEKVDMIYLCYPNNPTGAVATKDQLKAWVDYANKNDAVILFDAAYESFVTEDGIPRSIFEIEGAKTCALEFRSFSKTAGFTGTRCAFTVIPKELERGGTKVHALWNRRHCTKFNGVPYIIQKGAEAVYSPEGKKQVAEVLAYYKQNANTIKAGLESAGLTCYGATNSPYVWVKTPEGYGSWDFFDKILNEVSVVTTPGEGFGPKGEGYIRLSSFGDQDATKEAVARIQEMLKK